MCSHDLGGKINSISLVTVSVHCLIILIDLNGLLLYSAQLSSLTAVSHHTPSTILLKTFMILIFISWILNVTISGCQSLLTLWCWNNTPIMICRRPEFKWELHESIKLCNTWHSEHHTVCYIFCNTWHQSVNTNCTVAHYTLL
jgi:hypothetical protein